MFGITGVQFSYCAIYSLSVFSESFSLEPSEFTKSPNNRPNIEIMNKCVLLYWRVSSICERNASTRQVNITVS
jgi:hypothetical protein